MHVAHKIRLDLNNKEATYFSKAAGTARFAYNWALNEWNLQYEAWKNDPELPKPSQASLRRLLNSVKKEKYPWMQEVTKNAPQMAIIDLGKAFQNFFAGRAKHPTFHKKGVHDHFTLSNDQFIVEGSRIRIPLLGWVRMREPLRFSGKILSATLSREADHWMVSFTVEVEPPVIPAAFENQEAVGVDLGISTLATLSTGECIVGPRAYKTMKKKIRRLSKGLSRKQKGSRNREKAKMKLARLHAKTRHIREDSLHKLTTSLTRQYPVIVIEDLNVRGMLQNHHLACSIADMGFFEFKRQLLYKSAWRGGKVIHAGRWFPSSKTCSACGHVLKELPLSTRQWVCPVCASRHDRDVNAAINLRNLAVSSTVTACGEDRNLFRLQNRDGLVFEEAGNQH